MALKKRKTGERRRAHGNPALERTRVTVVTSKLAKEKQSQGCLLTLSLAGRVCHLHTIKLSQTPNQSSCILSAFWEGSLACVNSFFHAWESFGKGLVGQNCTTDHINSTTWVPVLGLRHHLHYRCRHNLCTVLCLSQTWSYNPLHHFKNNVEDLWFNSWRWSLSYYQMGFLVG